MGFHIDIKIFDKVIIYFFKSTKNIKLFVKGEEKISKII